MGAFLFYLLKSGCCLVVFYIFFKLLMSRSTFFRFNRITLLVGLLGCTLLPLIELTTTEETFLHTPLYAIHEILQSTESVILNPEQMEDPILISEKNPEINSLNWIPVTLAFIYGVGALVTLIWLSLSTCRLIQLIRTSEKKQFGNYVLVIPQQPTASFSWGKYIVISAADYSQQSEEILLHETMHLRNHHTLDLLFMQIFLLVYWFNPVVWLLKRELQEVHEFEADNGVINTGIDATKYQLLLVKKAVGTRLYSMANGFNHSKLKKRITMMLKEKSSPWARLKYLYVLPVAAIAVTAFARPEVSDKVEKISSVKVNDLAAIVETKVVESAGDTTKPADVKYVPAEVRKQLKGTPVFEVAEEMPEFPGGGMSAFMDYIKTNMRYPASAKENGTQGRVTVQFVVDEDGSIKDSKVLRSVDKDMDAEALRLINTMPKWKPGRQKGQPVAVKFTVPVMFRLDDDKLEKTSSANGITVEGYAGNGKEPLYIVDGKEVTPSVMSALNPDKIERVTVLKDKSATDLYGEEGQNGVVLITLKQGTPGMVIRRGNEVAENAKVQHKSSLDLIKTVYIDGEKVDLGTKTIDDLIPAENIEGIEVKKEAGGKGEIYITTKKTKAVEKTIAKGNMKVEGKVVDEQGEPVIGAAVLIEGTTTGSVTDVNGNFVLSVPSKDAVLVVSYIGMATGKVKVQPKLTITLKSE